jgi:hypothetical protein
MTRDLADVFPRAELTSSVFVNLGADRATLSLTLPLAEVGQLSALSEAIVSAAELDPQRFSTLDLLRLAAVFAAARQAVFDQAGR